MIRKLLIAVAVVIPATATLAIVTVISSFGGDGAAPADATGFADAAFAQLPETAGSTVDEVELDRMIGVFEARAPEREESLEYRTLGGLLLQRAELNADVADYRASADAYTTSLDLAPSSAEGLHGLARASLGIHDFATANRAAADFAALDGDDLDAVAVVGDAAFAVGDYERAGIAFERLAAARPDDPAVLVRLAQLDVTRGDSDAAFARAEAAVEAAVAQGLAEADLGFYEAYHGRLLFDHGRYEEAIALLETALARDPENQGTLGEVARVRAATGDTAGAVELLQTANDLVPEPDHLFLQADLQRLLGDDAGADAAVIQGLALATVDVDHERAWARAIAFYHLDHLDSGGDLAVGLAVAEAENVDRHDVGAWDLLAWARYRHGDLDGAQAAVDEALALDVPNAQVWFHAGVIAAERGDDQGAVELLERALELHPRFDPVQADEAVDLLDELRG